MEVYLDVVLIENFIVDLFLILVSFNIMKMKVKNKNVILGALIGSIYTLVIIFKSLSFFSSLIFQFVAAYLIVLVSLGYKKRKKTLKMWIIFLLNSFILSGLCYYLCQREMGYSFVKGTTISDFSTKNILISMMIIYISVERIVAALRERNLISNFIFNIEIKINNKIYVAKGFLDTGNELREPITNLPCILVEANILKDLEIDDDKLFYINYSAIGYSGRLKGFKAENVKIYSEISDVKEIDAVICPCEEVLNKDNEFNALLSRGVI